MKTRDPRRHQPLLRSGTTAFDGAGGRLVAGAGAGSSSHRHRPALCHESYLRSSSRNGRVVDLSSGNPEIKITRNVPRTSGVIPPKINRKGTSLFRRLFFFLFFKQLYGLQRSRTYPGTTEDTWMPSGAEVRKTFGDQRVCEALWSPKVFFCVPKLYDFSTEAESE